jgi:pimeloyl-ACP methyl ester carboxylesterase
MGPAVSQISLHGSSVTCYRWGDGPKIIIALHGYGEDGRSFAHWGQLLPPGFTLFAPDLPHHGSSTWQEDKPFTVTHLHELIGKITAGGTPPFTLCGYSMGGRLSLHFYEVFPQLVDRLVLVAPDGLKMNFWYWLSTQTPFGNRFFRYTMAHPGWFLASVKGLGKYGILNRGIVKYTGRYLGEAANRKHLYTVWTCMRTFRPDLRRIKSLIRLHRPEVKMIFGHYDQVIRPSQGYRFVHNTGGHCTLRELPTGHQLLLPAFGKACLQIVTG